MQYICSSRGAQQSDLVSTHRPAEMVVLRGSPPGHHRSIQLRCRAPVCCARAAPALVAWRAPRGSRWAGQPRVEAKGPPMRRVVTVGGWPWQLHISRFPPLARGADARLHNHVHARCSHIFRCHHRLQGVLSHCFCFLAQHIIMKSLTSQAHTALLQAQCCYQGTT